jgi:predicted alpha-1,2-mannosidase
MNKIILRSFLFLSAASLYFAQSTPLSLVSPLMGTDSSGQFSHGNTVPEVALPWPVNAWSTYTRPQSDPFYYRYYDKKILGIRQTHQPSPWMGDYANFALMPVSGKLVLDEAGRASSFSHENEISQPSYYQVRLDTWRVSAEITPTDRAARFRFHFEAPSEAFVVLDVFRSDRRCSVQIIPAENKIVGIASNNRGGVPANFANYFVIVFDQPFAAWGVTSSNQPLEKTTEIEGRQIGAFVKFAAGSDGRVECKVASSYLSAEQAALNLQREIGNADFDTVRQRAESRWNELLKRAEVESGFADQRRTFYSCLYRALLFPEQFTELDSLGRQVHYSPYDGKAHDGPLYTDSGFWDTFRAAHPLYTLLYPEVSIGIQRSLLNAVDESGWLPEWSSPGHRDIMIGENSFSLLADAWIKGLRDFDIQKAVAAMVHDANNEGPLPAVGRNGVQYYNSLGYVPYDNTKAGPSFREATAKTLEYAYDDFCAAQLAHAAGKDALARTFARHAMNYTNVFDPSVGFMRARKADGTWDEPFYPDEWGGAFTEGCPWHWTWCVFHDIPGLAGLLGGDQAMGAKLDAVFDTEPTVRPGTYGTMIHEMTEMVAGNMGQYAHGNEPVHHMVYLYDSVGQPWKAQSRVRQAMALFYQCTPDGYCGDEDTGQMSAWYVFSALGFYPMCPGDPEYLIGSPIFDKATLTFPDGKAFIITARCNGPQRPYIVKAALNGKEFNRVYLLHEEVRNGGEIVFDMTSAPDYKWGTGEESRPKSPLATLLGSIPQGEPK